MLRLSLLIVILGVAVVFGGALRDENQGWEGRIVGGQNAFIHQYPYMVSLRSAANVHFCGGSIMNTRYVLTAAHCVYRRAEANTIVAVAGTYLDGFSIQNAVARFVIHHSYDSDTLANDVGLVQTEAPILMTGSSSPIELSTFYSATATGAVFTGWGQRGVDDGMSNQLQMLVTNIINTIDCRTRFSEANAARVGSTKICTLSPLGQGTCMGDAGGPLVYDDAQQGVLSWGIPCALGAPDVYENMFIHRAWVLHNMT